MGTPRVQVGAQIKQQDVRGDKVLWLGAQALSATAFVKDGKRRKCKLHTLRSLVHAMDRFVQVVLAKCAPGGSDLARCSAAPRPQHPRLYARPPRAEKWATWRACASAPTQ